MNENKKFFTNVGKAVGFMGVRILFSPLTTAIGYVAGWTTKVCFGNMIPETLESFGIHGVSMEHLGALLGFVGLFLATRTTVVSEKDFSK